MPTRTSGPNTARDPELEWAWQNGVRLFNDGQFWQAHESFEFRWAELHRYQKTYIQILIQVCAAFFHLQRSRPAPAKKLCQSALKKWNALGFEASSADGLSHLEHWLDRARPRIESLSKILEDLIQILDDDLDEIQCQNLQLKLKNIKAQWETS